jgi:perosamine synthetase
MALILALIKTKQNFNMNRNNKALAINGGKPVTDKPVLIHLPYLDENDTQAVVDVMKSTFLTGDGKACREFEEKLASYLGVKYVLYVNSATSALELAFRVKDFKPGSEVLVPNFTYTSSALGALYNNLKIKLVDVRPNNGNIDVDKLEAAITSDTVAVVPVDYAGNPAEMDEVNRIAQKYGLYVVHDTAQSIGSRYKGKFTGNQAHVSTFSFHGTKNLTTGEGGAFVTNDDELAARVKILREKGTDKNSFLTGNITRGYYQYVDIGMSYVQSNILGGLGISQLQKIDFMNNRRKEIADYYLAHLKGIPDLEFLKQTDESQTNWHIFGILVPPEDKYWIMDALRAEGILSNVHYTPLHRNSYYAHLGIDAEFPGSMSFFNRFLRLPIYPALSENDILNVVNAVKKVFDHV